MRRQSGSALVQTMACRLFGAKPFSELVLRYCQLDRWEQSTVKLISKYSTFHSRNFTWKYHLRNVGHFVQWRWVKVNPYWYNWTLRYALNKSVFHRFLGLLHIKFPNWIGPVPHHVYSYLIHCPYINHFTGIFVCLFAHQVEVCAFQNTVIDILHNSTFYRDKRGLVRPTRHIWTHRHGHILSAPDSINQFLFIAVCWTSNGRNAVHVTNKLKTISILRGHFKQSIYTAPMKHTSIMQHERW